MLSVRGAESVLKYLTAFRSGRIAWKLPGVEDRLANPQFASEWPVVMGSGVYKPLLILAAIVTLNILKKDGFNEESSKPRNIRFGLKLITEIWVDKPLY